MKKIIYLTISITLVLSSCKSNKEFKNLAENNEFYNHLVQVKSDGHPINPATKKDYSNCYYENSQKFEEHLDYMFKDIKKQANNGPIKLRIFIHGGLNGTGGTVEKAYRDYKNMKEEDSTIYPIFINWNTSWNSSFWQNYSRIRNGERIPGNFKTSLGLMVSGPVMLLSDLAKGIIYIPHYYGEAFFGYRDGIIRLNQIKSNSYIDNLESSGIKISGKTPKNNKEQSLRRFGNWTENFFTSLTGAPGFILTYGVGTPLWQNMSRRIFSMYRNTEQFLPEKTSKNCDVNFDTKGKNIVYKNDLNGPVSLFFRKLIKESENNKFEIDIIGHSMGAMVWNEGLRLFGDSLKGNIKINNIVYMGAACSIFDWENGAYSFLKKNSYTQFYNLTLHPKREKEECYFPVLVPSGSLPEWIDRQFESPKSFENRTFGKYENFIYSISIINAQYRNRIHLKCFTYAHTKKEIELIPTKHGKFREKKYWRPEFWN